MHRSQFVPVIVLLMIFAYPAVSHATLADRLGESHFNLYPAPRPANNMILTDLTGKKFSLTNLRDKVVILNFWCVDCPPCAQEKPILERVYRKHGPRGLEVVSVNLFDPLERQRSYVQAKKFKFKFGCDPEKNLSVKKQVLPSGASTNFVVNSESEAIYEIPAVPTTYVIDRKGRVIGNSVGMVDWEKGPLAEFLESLLSGSVAQRVAEQQEGGDAFALEARQGRSETPRNDGKRVAQAGPGVADAPRSSTGTPKSGGEGPRLPFQSRGATPPSATAVPPPAVPVTPEAAGKGSAEIAVPGRGPASAGAVKSGAAATKPKPKRPDQAPAAAQRTGPEGQRKGSGLKPAGVPPAAGAAGRVHGRPAGSLDAPATGASEAGTVKSLPPLPPALPYIPPGGRAAVPPAVAPGTDGTILARVPRFPTGVPGGTVRPYEAPSEPTGSLPQARPLTPTNPISGFILDSFPPERPVPISPQVGERRPAPQRPATPARGQSSTIFGQLTHDVKQLGQGIKGAVGQLLPGQ